VTTTDPGANLVSLAIITAGHDNQTARTVAFRRDETINERALVTVFRQIVANNRAGGWRKLKGAGRA
jgi:hypothetical protein